MIEKKNTLKPLISLILYGAKPLGLPLRRSGCLAQYYPGNLVAPIGPCRFLYPLFKTSPKIPRVQSSLNMPTKKTYAKKQKVSKFLYPISITATGSAAQSYFWLLIRAQLEDANSLSVNCPLIPPKTVTTML